MNSKAANAASSSFEKGDRDVFFFFFFFASVSSQRRYVPILKVSTILVIVSLKTYSKPFTVQNTVADATRERKLSLRS